VSEAPAIAAVRAALASRDDVRLAVLFGSVARHTGTRQSDLDVAFIPESDTMTLAEEGLLQTQLERATGRAVDLVRLDRASTLLRWRVARDGLLLLERAPFAFARFRAEAASAYIDFAPSFEACVERFRVALVRRAETLSR